MGQDRCQIIKHSGLSDSTYTDLVLPGNFLLLPLEKRLGEPWGQSGWVQTISPPPGFEPRTVQPVVSHYTHYAILAARECTFISYFHFIIKGFRFSIIIGLVMGFFFFLIH
jgi:hypothetical protein